MCEGNENTLFNRIGVALNIPPQTAVDVVAGMFVDRLLADERVSQFFEGMSREQHVQHLAGFVAVAFGKQATYNFSKEGVDNLTKAHEGLGITAKHFAIVASHLQSCLEDAKVPPHLVQEAISIVGSTQDAVLGNVPPPNKERAADRGAFSAGALGIVAGVVLLAARLLVSRPAMSL